MIAGLKKQDRDIGALLSDQVQQSHTIVLKAGGDAGLGGVRQSDCDVCPGFVDEPVERHRIIPATHTIMPPATVALVWRSIRMKLPVIRFCLKASKNSGRA